MAIDQRIVGVLFQCFTAVYGRDRRCDHRTCVYSIFNRDRCSRDINDLRRNSYVDRYTVRLVIVRFHSLSLDHSCALGSRCNLAVCIHRCNVLVAAGKCHCCLRAGNTDGIRAASLKCDLLFVCRKRLSGLLNRKGLDSTSLEITLAGDGHRALTGVCVSAVSYGIILALDQVFVLILNRDAGFLLCAVICIAFVIERDHCFGYYFDIAGEDVVGDTRLCSILIIDPTLEACVFISCDVHRITVSANTRPSGLHISCRVCKGVRAPDVGQPGIAFVRCFCAERNRVPLIAGDRQQVVRLIVCADGSICRSSCQTGLHIDVKIHIAVISVLILHIALIIAVSTGIHSNAVRSLSYSIIFSFVIP